jgi:hypothetical protein
MCFSITGHQSPSYTVSMKDRLDASPAVKHISSELRNIFIHHPEMRNTSQHDKDVKNFMKSEEVRPGVWQFDRIDNCTDCIE